MEWQVEFFVDDAGHRPVKEFLAELPREHVGKVVQVIQMLEERGPNLPFPYSSQVEGSLRELRAHYGRALYRILYYGDVRRRFVLLHILAKQTASLPRQDIQIALSRMTEDHERKKKQV